MITGIIIGLYILGGLICARRAYRHEYNLVYGTPAPSCYGGKNGHDKAHQVAMAEAVWQMALWAPFLCWTVLDWVISNGTRQTWVERDNMINRLQDEIDRLAEDQGDSKNSTDTLSLAAPLVQGETAEEVLRRIKPELCPCGYRTECPIHCGDGSCHRGDSWLWKDDAADRVITPSEIIRTRRPDLIGDHMKCGDIQEYDVGTLADPEKKIFMDGMGHMWEG